jgi:ABC-type polar amino acid transport system ATPase subunit
MCLALRALALLAGMSSATFCCSTNPPAVGGTNKVLTIMRESAEARDCVFVTHHIYHAYQVCDRFVVMAHGTVQASVIKAEVTNIVMEH